MSVFLSSVWELLKSIKQPAPPDSSAKKIAYLVAAGVAGFILVLPSISLKGPELVIWFIASTFFALVL